jgi:hypothetical protein
MSASNLRIVAGLFAAVWVGSSVAFSTQTPLSATSSVVSKSPMFEYLKFDKNPQFDVLERTQEYIKTNNDQDTFREDWYAEDYVLRGPVIGPIDRAALKKNQDEGGLGVKEAFPDIKIESFGFTVDPENPYRCFYFQRWRGTNTGDLVNFGTTYPATGTQMETPLSIFSVVWNPEGKIVYEQVGAVVDRFEGNTEGKAAIFGMLHAAGLKIPAQPGNKVFAFIQRLAHLAGNLGRSWSKEEDIPKWWISKSRGADANDIYF